MKYKILGNTGIKVSELALGTMTFGEDFGWGASREVSTRLLDVYADAGGNLIDTANIYTGGTSEKIVGELLKDRRDRFVLSTKYTQATDGADPNSAGNSRKSLRHALDDSLKRLQTDYIDLYWVHLRDVLTPVEEVMRALDDQVRAGKILAVAVSDWSAWEIAQANTAASLRGLTPFSAVQLRYNLLERTPEHELLPMAESFGIPAFAWGPLAEGRLTGKYLSGGTGRLTEGGDFGFSQNGSDDIVREVIAIAGEGGWTPAQVAIAWLLHKPHTVIPLVSGRTEAQLADNIAAVDVTLTPEQIARLDAVSEIAPIFPHNVALQRGIALGTYSDHLPDIADPRAQRLFTRTI